MEFEEVLLQILVFKVVLLLAHALTLSLVFVVALAQVMLLLVMLVELDAAVTLFNAVGKVLDMEKEAGIIAGVFVTTVGAGVETSMGFSGSFTAADCEFDPFNTDDGAGNEIRA